MENKRLNKEADTVNSIVADLVYEIKTDNNPENIIVMTRSEHSKHHQNFRK